MRKRIPLLVTVLIGIVMLAFRPTKQVINYPATDFYIDTLATGLTVPWSIAFINQDTMLFSERNGKVRMMVKSILSQKHLLTIKEIDTTKKMGLLAICLHPDFMTNRYVYVSYNYSSNNAAWLRVERYRFVTDSLVDAMLIIDSIHASQNHTGCRLQFGPDKKLYITTGDADRPILAQDLKSLNGKILRVNEDGSIPADNPFVKNDTARKEIWTYGHRNTQGIAFDPVTNELYNSEHGPTGGDEINHIEKGMNYGWPVIHHQQAKEGMQPPLEEFTPSIGPSEMIFYSGNTFPTLKGSLLLACLRGESIIQMQLEKGTIVSKNYLLQKQYGRMRALAVGPDGFIYFSTSQNDPPEGRRMPGYDMICRIRPAGNGSIAQHAVVNDSALVKNFTGKRTTANLYLQLCAGCHGNTMQGTERAKSMLDDQWDGGGRKEDLLKSIRDGMIPKGMPAWEGSLTSKEIENLASYILRENKRNRK